MLYSIAAMDGRAFVAELAAEIERRLAKLGEPPAPPSREAAAAQLPALLKIALKNEAEAVEIAASWVASTPELEAKLAFAEHAGDEARHYRLLEESIRALGADLAGYDPLSPPSPVLEYLRTLGTTPERVAAALVARERMGSRRNAQFLGLLGSAGHAELARLYREVINPDEDRHHRAGCELLARLAATPETQRAARRAAERLLEIGDKVRQAMLAKTGAAAIPGC